MSSRMEEQGRIQVEEVSLRKGLRKELGKGLGKGLERLVELTGGGRDCFFDLSQSSNQVSICVYLNVE